MAASNVRNPKQNTMKVIYICISNDELCEYIDRFLPLLWLDQTRPGRKWSILLMYSLLHHNTNKDRVNPDLTPCTMSLSPKLLALLIPYYGTRRKMIAAFHWNYTKFSMYCIFLAINCQQFHRIFILIQYLPSDMLHMEGCHSTKDMR